jgi:hypothetical protein
MSEIETFRKTCPYRDTAMPAGEVLSAPERLVGVGFRCWLAGYQTSDIGCWEVAWHEFSQAVGPREAKPLMAELACWVRAVQDGAGRKIEVYPAPCRRFCRDECLAISMVAACQHSACPAFRACAVALLGSNKIDETIEGAECFARSLQAADQVLPPSTVFMGAGLVSPGVQGHS